MTTSTSTLPSTVTRSKFGRFLDRYDVSADDVARIIALRDRDIASATRVVRGWASGSSDINEPEMYFTATAVGILCARRVHPSELFDTYAPSDSDQRAAIVRNLRCIRRLCLNRAGNLALGGEIELRAANAE